MNSPARIALCILLLLPATLSAKAQSPRDPENVAAIVATTRVPSRFQRQMVTDINAFSQSLIDVDGPRIREYLFDPAVRGMPTADSKRKTYSLTCMSAALTRAHLTSVEITGIGTLAYMKSLPPEKQSWLLYATVEWNDGVEVRRKNCAITCAWQAKGFKFLPTDLVWILTGSDCSGTGSQGSAFTNGRPTSD